MNPRLLLLLAAILPAGAATFTVSPDGNDAGNGTAAAPFQTIARARDAVRALPEAERHKPIAVILCGGVYRLDETLVFGLADGGSKDAPVVYRAAEGETPVLTSTVPVTGWRKLTEIPEGTPEAAKAHLWVADMPKGVERFHVLFNGNRMLERARGRGFDSPRLQSSFRACGERRLSRRSLGEDGRELASITPNCSSLRPGTPRQVRARLGRYRPVVRNDEGGGNPSGCDDVQAPRRTVVRTPEPKLIARMTWIRNALLRRINVRNGLCL